MDRRRRLGFSLIEALVVLAVGGMALAIIFSIGVRAGDTGFKLGRRALSAADLDLGVSDLRSLIRSISVIPPALIQAELDRPPMGTTSRFEADIVAERATQCAPSGWSGRLILELVQEGGRARLVCSGPGSPVTLLDLPGRAQFSYSEDGATWTEVYAVGIPESRALDALTAAQLFVRLSARPEFDVVEGATSGRPQWWGRADVE